MRIFPFLLRPVFIWPTFPAPLLCTSFYSVSVFTSPVFLGIPHVSNLRSLPFLRAGLLITKNDPLPPRLSLAFVRPFFLSHLLGLDVERPPFSLGTLPFFSGPFPTSAPWSSLLVRFLSPVYAKKLPHFSASAQLLFSLVSFYSSPLSSLVEYCFVGSALFLTTKVTSPPGRRFPFDNGNLKISVYNFLFPGCDPEIFRYILFLF